MSKHFGKVQNYYNLGVWDITRVENAVQKGWITESEFKDITDKDYPV